jgi:hypothetical protein
MIMPFLSLELLFMIRTSDLGRALQASAANVPEEGNRDLIHKLAGVCRELCIPHFQLSCL